MKLRIKIAVMMAVALLGPADYLADRICWWLM
jgi:hypothetical protein